MTSLDFLQLPPRPADGTTRNHRCGAITEAFVCPIWSARHTSSCRRSPGRNLASDSVQRAPLKPRVAMSQARLARVSRPALPVLRRTAETDVAQFRISCVSALRFATRTAKCLASFERRSLMWGQRLEVVVVLVVETVLPRW